MGELIESDAARTRAQAKALTDGMKGLLEGGTTAFFQRRLPLLTLGRRAEVAAPAPAPMPALAPGPSLGSYAPPAAPTTMLIRPIPAAAGLARPEMARPFDSSPAGRIVPLLGQDVPATPPPQAAPPPPSAPMRKCPGPVEMPDGRIIQPTDTLTLNDFCELLPFLLEAEQAAAQQTRGLAPGQRVPVAGGIPGVSAVPTTGGAFGPAGSVFAGGGGAMFGGGGGGPGPAGAQGPVGPPGPAGPAGPAGVGVTTDFVVKTDGDFTAGPGAFIPVPGTLVAFTQGSDGPMTFFIQAVFGCSPNAQSGQIGLRVDGTTIFPLSARLMHTFVGGVGEFLTPISCLFPVILPAGAHTVEIMLRGLVGGMDFCDSGVGEPITLQANPSIPAALVVLHR